MAKKRVLVGVTGGIAAYKAADLVSSLVKQAIEVQVIMTDNATRFVSPLTFEALSGRPVWRDEFNSGGGLTVPHVQLANEADLFAIVPATANTVAKLARGIADNLLTSVALAYNKTMLLAPAMNTNMYTHPAVQENLNVLKDRGVRIIEPASGRLACGISGTGKLAPVDSIVAEIQWHLFEPKNLLGRKVIVTAGGTREKIDPVRYIGNLSSGKMGFAIARAAWLRGAEVVLISGPVGLLPPYGVSYYSVESAAQMQDLVLQHFDDADIVVKAAAVADYRVVNPGQQKLKKSSPNLELMLTKNPDILKELGKKKKHQVLVGFAAETEELLNNAREKLNEKNLDLIVANDVTCKNAGFGADTNEVVFLFPDGRQEALPLMSKEMVAHRIFQVMENIPQFKKYAEYADDKESN